MRDFSPCGRLLRVWSVMATIVAVTASDAFAGQFAVSRGREWQAVRNQVDAAQFLQKTTFGPTLEEIDALAARIKQVGRLEAYDEWLEAEFAKPVGSHLDMTLGMIATDGYTPSTRDAYIQRYRQNAWWELAVTGDDQLRQRVAWALIQILVTSRWTESGDDVGPDADGTPAWLGTIDYYDMLVENAFGNYRDILEHATYHPVMGQYLSHVRNQKADPSIGRYPDENFAREIMQLFTIGTVRLNQNGTIRMQTDPISGARVPQEAYGNDRIKAMARVFTGLGYAADPNAPDNFWTWNRMSRPMKMYDAEHDTGVKRLLLGVTLPAGQSGDDDIAAALDNLFSHPNVGPFLARRLIQRLVYSNPSKGYIYRVAAAFQDNGQGVRGDMKAVIKAIYLDNEAINCFRRLKVYETIDGERQLVAAQFKGRGTEYSKLREPVLRQTAFYRAYQNGSDHPSGQLRMDARSWVTQQAPYESPSVFNYYLPNHRPAGDFAAATPSGRIPNGELYGPEFQLMNSSTANDVANMFLWDVSAQKVQFSHYVNEQTQDKVAIDLDFSIEEQLAADPADHPLLMEHLDLLLCAGTMHEANKQDVLTQLNAPDLYQNDPQLAEFRAEMAILLLLVGPDGALQR